MLMFRLAENLMVILVHESVKSHLLNRGILTGAEEDVIEFLRLDETAIL